MGYELQARTSGGGILENLEMKELAKG